MSSINSKKQKIESSRQKILDKLCNVLAKLPTNGIPAHYRTNQRCTVGSSWRKLTLCC